MKVLIVYGSKHGATKEIAEAIALVLRERNHEVDLYEPQHVVGIAQYDAAIVGSAVYAGQWRKAVREFVVENAKTLSERPTWFFSSGPVGRPPQPSTDLAVDIEALLAITNIQDHVVFGGKIDPHQLNFAERAIVFTVGGSEGDYRNWDEIENWATGIAKELTRREG